MRAGHSPNLTLSVLSSAPNPESAAAMYCCTVDGAYGSASDADWINWKLWLNDQEIEATRNKHAQMVGRGGAWLEGLQR